MMKLLKDMEILKDMEVLNRQDIILEINQQDLEINIITMVVAMVANNRVMADNQVDTVDNQVVDMVVNQAADLVAAIEPHKMQKLYLLEISDLICRKEN